MNNEILVAIISFAGTAVGSIVAVVTANSLTNFKIEELKKQVEKHNTIVDRVYKLEASDQVRTEEIKVINHRIEDLEKS
jgi:uncharacterized protein (DUF697 family)